MITPRTLIICVILLCQAVSAQISRPTLYRPQVFDVEHYDVRINFPEPSTRRVEGRVDSRIRWQGALRDPEYRFHLRGLTIDSIVIDGRQYPWKTYGVPADDSMHHRVVVTGDHDSASATTVSIYYRGTMTNEGGTSPWGGVHYDDSVLYALGVGFANASVSATQHWMPCYDHPSDKATFSARFTVPDSTWLVASNGLGGAREKGSDGVVTYIWSEQKPVATYLLTFAAARFRLLTLSGRVPHVVYTLRRDSAVSSRSYRLIPQMTDVYSSLYGEYPFDKVGYYNSLKGSMEHQGMIALALSEARRGDTANVTAAHELAHQWFGDCLSPRDFRYAWLTESFATYSECSWLESLRGWNIYLSAVQSKAKSYMTQIAPNEGVFALEDFPRKAPSSNYPGTIYAKGAVVLAMARAIVGDSAFYAMLQQYVADHAYGTVTTDDFRRAAQRVMGERTEAFFAEWVTGIGWPKLQIDQVVSQMGVSVAISQIQRQTNPTWPVFTALPVNVVYVQRREGSAAMDTVDTILYPDAEGNIRLTCQQLLGVNTGRRSRCLLEIVRTTDTPEDDASVGQTIELMPQPASESVTIRRTGDVSSADVQIVTLRGDVVGSSAFEQGAQELVLDVASLPAGTYSVLVRAARRQARLPLMITRGE